MKRPSLRERVLDSEPRGKDVFFIEPDDTSIVNDQPSTVDDRPITWTDLHHRVTFYCPKDLLVKLEENMRIMKQSKSQVIVGALEALLNEGKGHV